MYIQVHESMYKYKHVCTMFSSVHTDLPYPVQVVRIPDDCALCRGFDPCRRRPRGVAVDFGPKQSGWLINQLGNPSLVYIQQIKHHDQEITNQED